jgi:hypothetical protein
MDNDRLTSTAAVVDALGGIQAVAYLTGSNYKAAANWKSFATFPAKTFLVMTDALERIGKSAPASLWGMTEPSTHEPERVSA